MAGTITTRKVATDTGVVILIVVIGEDCDSYLCYSCDIYSIAVITVKVKTLKVVIVPVPLQ